MPAAAEEFFAGHPDGLAVYRAVAEAVSGLGECEERVSKSQVAFRRVRGFAYVWRPGQYLRSTVPAVLSIALPAQLESARIKQVVHTGAAGHGCTTSSCRARARWTTRSGTGSGGLTRRPGNSLRASPLTWADALRKSRGEASPPGALAVAHQKGEIAVCGRRGVGVSPLRLLVPTYIPRWGS